jgi:glycosyltransferase involved in cell wall biosynthesis
VRVISGPDEGLYDGLNKAIAATRGDVVGHLNSDDVYLPGAFAAAMEAFESHPNIASVAGGAELARRDARGGWQVFSRLPAERFADLDWQTVMRGPTLTNARFYRRRIFEEFGLYDVRYKVVADREFLLRLTGAGVETGVIDHMVIQYRHHPGSLTFNSDAASALRGVEDKLRVAEAFLASAQADDPVARHYRDWHLYEASEGVILGLRAGAAGAALRYVKRGFRQPFAWPPYLLRRLLALGKGELYGLVRRWKGDTADAR